MFKVGDRVRITRVATVDEYNLWYDSWNSIMNDYIGKVGTITEVHKSRPNVAYHKYNIKGCDTWWYPEFVLQGVVGEQLLFDFMGELK